MAPSALVKFNLVFCLVEAASKGGGSAQGEVDLSAVAIAGGHKKEEQVQFSLEEHEHGHEGEAEDETNDDGVAFVEVTATGELKTTAPILPPRHSAFAQVSDLTGKRENQMEKKKKKNKTVKQEEFIRRVSHEQTGAEILEWESSTTNAKNKVGNRTRANSPTKEDKARLYAIGGGNVPPTRGHAKCVHGECCKCGGFIEEKWNYMHAKYIWGKCVAETRVHTNRWNEEVLVGTIATRCECPHGENLFPSRGNKFVVVADVYTGGGGDNWIKLFPSGKQLAAAGDDGVPSDPFGLLGDHDGFPFYHDQNPENPGCVGLNTYDPHATMRRPRAELERERLGCSADYCFLAGKWKTEVEKIGAREVKKIEKKK